MAKRPNRDPKTRALQQEASLHPHPEQVTDELFFESRVFRSARLGSGQVRDATPGAKRGTSGQPVGSPLRLLASLVLPSAGCVPAGRYTGTDATETRAEECAQTHCRSVGSRPPSTAGRFLPSSNGLGSADQKPIRLHGSSAQHRARLDAQSKKTAVKESLPQSIAQQ